MIVGVTGHQDLGAEEQVAWVKRTLDGLVRHHNVTRGLSSLAVGADQLFANAILDAGAQLFAVIPCGGYDGTFADPSDRRTFEALLARATHCHQLPYVMPTEQAFLAAGEWIVSHCDLLFAVWNGLPARGLGGTADVVSFAKSSARDWIHINPTTRAVSTHIKEG